eukprot:TRINITY_DN47330_c0_g1_i1.p1 TRINITY_DN47330_c0_g1~~TRINITY_DN47330_c0_g1_i1.p1  ORF type:complete len:548 (+),score=56.76 TRINITY_DN47330_c0_g1_i1:29-1672(+)
MRDNLVRVAVVCPVFVKGDTTKYPRTCCSYSSGVVTLQQASQPCYVGLMHGFCSACHGFVAIHSAVTWPPATRVNLHLRGRRGRALQAESGGREGKLELELIERDPTEWRRRESRRIAAFAGPALSMPLADPLMSFIDTAMVGRAAGTLQLASLGPNTVIFNFVNYVVNFLGIATLTIMGRELAEGRREQAARSLSHALGFSLIIGVALGVLLQCKAVKLLTLCGAAESAAYFSSAAQYLRIRAVSLPAFTAMIVLQSALLAQQESRAPAVAVLIAAAVNIAGDALLIIDLKLGAAGAAYATVFGELVAAAMLLVVLPGKGRLPRQRPRLPNLVELKPFAAALGPLSVFKVSKNLCYGVLQSTATAMGAVECAAHQSVWVLWSVLSFMGEPLSQAAQVLLPQRFAAAQQGKRQRRLLRETLRMLVGASIVWGLLLGCIAGLLPAFAPQLFSPDAVLWDLIRSVAVPSTVAAVLSTISCPVEGALLAQGKLFFMAGRMSSILVVIIAGMHGIRTSAYGGQGLVAVWWWLAGFFALRVVVMGLQLRRRK